MDALQKAVVAYESGGYREALEIFSQLAEAGDPDAMRSLAHMHHHGYGCPVDVVKAADWYLRAWKQKDEEAAEAICELVPELEKRAEEGIARAQFARAVISMHLRADLKAGISYLKSSADQGHAEALQLLGDCYRLGRGVEVDNAEAYRYYKLASDLCDPKALYQMGRYVSEGMGGQQRDLEAGLSWYRRAADAGFWPANMALCKLLAARNRDRNDARECVQRLRALAAANPHIPKYSISSGDGEWSVVISDRGNTIGLSGMTSDDLGWDRAFQNET